VFDGDADGQLDLANIDASVPEVREALVAYVRALTRAEQARSLLLMAIERFPNQRLRIVKGRQVLADEDSSRDRTRDVEKLAYSIDEAAGALSVGRTSIERLIRRGELSSLKVGKRRIITREHIDRFLGGLGG
jgi:excisionase family DNA binding protein